MGGQAESKPSFRSSVITSATVNQAYSYDVATGAVVQKETDQLSLYYGAADCTVAVATANLSEVIDYIMSCPEAKE